MLHITQTKNRLGMTLRIIVCPVNDDWRKDLLSFQTVQGYAGEVDAGPMGFVACIVGHDERAVFHHHAGIAGVAARGERHHLMEACAVGIACVEAGRAPISYMVAA